MSAYAYYEAGSYDDCINAARRYVTLHPGSPDAAYAQYLIGASYFDQIPEISRDQDRTGKQFRTSKRSPANIPTPNTPSPPSARSRSLAISLPARRWTLGVSC